jgi:hypothetical protein
MSRAIEDKAKEYLLRDFKHARYKFTDKDSSERGFDLWMRDERSGDRVRVELKATGGEYRKWSDIFQKLYFSAANEVKNFERGHTKVLRVFLGNKPRRVFLFDRGVLEHGARFETEFRAKIVGKINYEEITEIGSEAKK